MDDSISRFKIQKVQSSLHFLVTGHEDTEKHDKHGKGEDENGQAKYQDENKQSKTKEEENAVEKHPACSSCL